MMAYFLITRSRGIKQEEAMQFVDQVLYNIDTILLVFVLQEAQAQ